VVRHGPVEFFVDFEELARLHTELQELADELAEISLRTVDADAGAMGGADVADAVHHFVTGWRDGRRQIAANIGACQVYVHQALDAYLEVENGIRNALTASAATVKE
jgi:hypothetical protein